MTISGDMQHGLVLKIKYVAVLGGIGDLENIGLIIGGGQMKILIPLTWQLPGINLKHE